MLDLNNGCWRWRAAAVLLKCMCSRSCIFTENRENSTEYTHTHARTNARRERDRDSNSWTTIFAGRTQNRCRERRQRRQYEQMMSPVSKQRANSGRVCWSSRPWIDSSALHTTTSAPSAVASSSSMVSTLRTLMRLSRSWSALSSEFHCWFAAWLQTAI